MTIPHGMAMVMATLATTSVPDSSGRMPNFGSANSGLHCVPVRNSQSGT